MQVEIKGPKPKDTDIDKLNKAVRDYNACAAMDISNGSPHKIEVRLK